MVEPYNEKFDVYNFTLIYDYIYESFVLEYPGIYMRIHGLPLLCFFNGENMTKPTNRAKLDDSRFQTKIVGNNNFVHWWFWEPAPKLSPADCFITICPRYDDTRLGRENPKVYDPTLQEGFYDNQWNEALGWVRQGKVEYIAIYSWNEFNERSQIEPCYDKTSYSEKPYFLFNKTEHFIKLIKSG